MWLLQEERLFSFAFRKRIYILGWYDRDLFAVGWFEGLRGSGKFRQHVLRVATGNLTWTLVFKWTQLGSCQP